MVEELLDADTASLIPLVGVKKACELLGRVRSTFYRRRQPRIAKESFIRQSPPNALSEPERAAVLALLNEPEHCDLAIDQVYARTLDEGIYLCSPATMHRLLAKSGASSDRRAQRTHPAKKRPELLAAPTRGQNGRPLRTLELFTTAIRDPVARLEESPQSVK